MYKIPIPHMDESYARIIIHILSTVRSLRLHVEAVLGNHPSNTDSSEEERKEDGRAEVGRAIYSPLGSEVEKGDDVGPDSDVVHGRNVDVVARIDTDDGG